MIEEKAKNIKWFVFDVDGVLTDGKIIYDSEGRELKNFCVKDGLGIYLLYQAGINTAIITGRNSITVERRAKELHITEIIQGAKEKLPAYISFKEKYNIKDEEILFIGDDYIDLPILRRVGFPVSVPSAPDIVKKYCIYITKKEGGNGAVREVVELILDYQGKLEELIKKFYLI